MFASASPLNLSLALLDFLFTVYAQRSIYSLTLKKKKNHEHRAMHHPREASNAIYHAIRIKQLLPAINYVFTRERRRESKNKKKFWSLNPILTRIHSERCNVALRWKDTRAKYIKSLALITYTQSSASLLQKISCKEEREREKEHSARGLIYREDRISCGNDLECQRGPEVATAAALVSAPANMGATIALARTRVVRTVFACTPERERERLMLLLFSRSWESTDVSQRTERKRIATWLGANLERFSFFFLLFFLEDLQKVERFFLSLSMCVESLPFVVIRDRTRQDSPGEISANSERFFF